MQRVRISVYNANWDDATLHAYREGERIRLGVVAGKSDREFVLDWRSTALLRVRIALVGGEACVTRGVVVSPGERVEVRVASDLSLDPECVRVARPAASQGPPLRHHPATSLPGRARP